MPTSVLQQYCLRTLKDLTASRVLVIVDVLLETVLLTNISCLDEHASQVKVRNLELNKACHDLTHDGSGAEVP